MIFNYACLLKLFLLSLSIDTHTIMLIFKDQKVGINELLGFIPEALLSHLSENTKVDYYSKVLHGKKLFYLLMYGVYSEKNDRLNLLETDHLNLI